MKKKAYPILFIVFTIAIFSFFCGCKEIVTKELPKKDNNLDKKSLNLVDAINFSIEDVACSHSETVVLIHTYNNFSGQAKMNFQSGPTFSINHSKTIIPMNSTKTIQLDIKAGTILPLIFERNNPYVGIYEICLDDKCQTKGDCYNVNKYRVECMKLSGSKESCTSNSKCIYKGISCEKFSCNLVDEKNMCESNSVCKWENKDYYDNSGTIRSGYCRESGCYDYKDLDSCTAKNCTWISGTCSIPTCDNYKTNESCSNSGLGLGCYWYNNNCYSHSCQEIRDETKCDSFSICQWENGMCYMANVIG